MTCTCSACISESAGAYQLRYRQNTWRPADPTRGVSGNQEGITVARTNRRRRKRSGIARFMDNVRIGWLQPVALTALLTLTGTSSTILQIPPLPEASGQ